MNPESIHCQTCGHHPKSIFCYLAGTHLQHLDTEKSVYKYRRGQVVYYEGHPADAAYCIFEGRLKIYKVGRKDEETVIRLLGPGDITGYRAMLADEPYAATAEAIEDTTVCSISRSTLTGLLREVPDMAMRMLAELSRELRVSEEQMMSLAQETVLQRTARILLWLHRTSAQPDVSEAPQLDLPLRKSELAQMIGSTPESLSRALHELGERYVISVKKDSIIITDLSSLARLAGSRPSA